MIFTVNWEEAVKLPVPKDPSPDGCPPYYLLILSPRQEAEYAAIGVPTERRPLCKALLKDCGELGAQPGQLVVDAIGRWCIVTR